MISNDTAYVPALLAPHPEWQGAYDQDGPLAVETRRKLLDRVIADKMVICGAHFPFPGAGTFAKDGAGYAFTPVKALARRPAPVTSRNFQVQTGYSPCIQFETAPVLPCLGASALRRAGHRVVGSSAAFAVDNDQFEGCARSHLRPGQDQGQGLSGALAELKTIADTHQHAESTA